MGSSLRELHIPIIWNCPKNSPEGDLLVVARRDGLLEELSKSEAEEQGVSPWQLYECTRYEYELPNGCTFNVNADADVLEAVITMCKYELANNEYPLQVAAFASVPAAVLQ